MAVDDYQRYLCFEVINRLIDELRNIQVRMQGQRASQIQGALKRRIRQFFEGTKQPFWYEAHHQAALLIAMLEAQGENNLKNIVMEAWQELVLENYRSSLLPQQLNTLGLNTFYDTYLNPKVSLSLLPRYSFWIRLRFRLIKPFLSKDDVVLYPIDNPTMKDWVFKLPIIRASTWKGSFRQALRYVLDRYGQSDGEIIGRLCGPLQEDIAEEATRGRLCFYPTFFEQLSLEVLNPHDREKRVGTQPISLESVPEGATGYFHLLYAPGDLMDENNQLGQAQEDFLHTLRGVHAMLTEYGFSAKRSSGFGVAQPIMEGCIIEVKSQEIAEMLLWEALEVTYRLPMHLYEDIEAIAREIAREGGNGDVSRTT